MPECFRIGVSVHSLSRLLSGGRTAGEDQPVKMQVSVLRAHQISVLSARFNSHNPAFRQNADLQPFQFKAQSIQNRGCLAGQGINIPLSGGGQHAHPVKKLQSILRGETGENAAQPFLRRPVIIFPDFFHGKRQVGQIALPVTCHQNFLPDPLLFFQDDNLIPRSLPVICSSDCRHQTGSPASDNPRFSSVHHVPHFQSAAAPGHTRRPDIRP